jgi:YegS/Rv2252/BmrU family lipid kinase
MVQKRFVVVVNPRAGRGRGLAVLDRVRPAFAAARASLDIRIAAQLGDITEIVRTLGTDPLDGLCVVGGDGTLHEAVAGLVAREPSHRPPLGIIPAGTGNSVGQHLGCLDPSEAVRRILSGNVREFDLARVVTGGRTVHCVNLMGWGAVVDINRTAEYLRAFGPSRYSLAALAHIVRARPRQAKLVLDGRVIEDEFLFVAVCNTKFIGNGMQLAPRAEVDDARLDVVLIRRATRLQMLRMFRRVFDGSHLSVGCVEYHQVRFLGIESDRVGGLNLDGEQMGATPVTVDVMPAALRVFG